MSNIDKTKVEVLQRNLNPEKYTRSLATNMSEARSPKIGQFEIRAKFENKV